MLLRVLLVPNLKYVSLLPAMNATPPPSTQPRHIAPIETPSENCWLFTPEEVAETPSRLDGISAELEARVIAKSAHFIHDAGRELSVPQLTMSTACIFFQRFYMLESMCDHSPPDVAVACLFLACKTQETHKRLKDVIYWTHKVRTRGTKDFPDGNDLFEDSPGFFMEKNKVLDKEREVLRVLNFDLTVDPPYRHMWLLAKTFLSSKPETRQTLTQTAWNFLNDSFRTYVPVMYDSREIATAALFLSAKMHDYALPDGRTRNERGERMKAWHELFHCDLRRIEEIGNRMLDIYDVPDRKRSEIVGNGHAESKEVEKEEPMRT